MTSNKALRHIAALAFAALILALPAHAETLVGKNVDSRVLVGFDVAPDSVQSLMPDGWMSVPFPGGPLKGANLLMVLIDRSLQLDPEGKPDPAKNGRFAAFVGLAQKDGKPRLYVLRIYATLEGYDPYGNTSAADISREITVKGGSGAAREVDDAWEISAADGTLSMSLSYTEGRRNWTSDEARPFSNANPEFFRIYRYDQLVDLVMSEPVGKPLAGNFSVSGGLQGFEAMFQAAGQPVAIIDVPVYVREVYLP